MRKIQMVDLHSQLVPMRAAIDEEICKVIDAASFIKGGHVNNFEHQLQEYQGSQYAISCGNGTDALQIALMSLGLEQGAEVIIPAFAYAAVAEVVLLLGFKPVLVDVEYDSFNIDASLIDQSITARTKVIMPVHLFGLMADMDSILEIASANDLTVIEDNAQSIGCATANDGRRSGSIGHIGCTSFFPSKNLGCFGDGGAMTTNNEVLAAKLRMITTHGQREKYHHDAIGVNSRLDTLQAAVLGIKIKYLDEFIKKRKLAAAYYDQRLSKIDDIIIPTRSSYSDHVFHQYTLKVPKDSRERLIDHMRTHEVPCAIYYPLPLHQQKAYQNKVVINQSLAISESLSQEVIAIPMHTELDDEQLDYITSIIAAFFTS